MSDTSQSELCNDIEGDADTNESPVNGASDAESSYEASGKQDSDGPLPFESLAVELEEDENSALMIENEETNDNGCLPEADISCTGSDDAVMYDEENNCELQEPSDADENSKLANPEEMMEQTLLSKVHSEEEDSIVGYNEAPVETEDDTTVVIKQEVMEEQEASISKTYIEDFIYSTGSNIIPDSDSTSNDEKGVPLNRFTAIKKTVECADYETLQDLYQLLYLRNAWDTEKILVKRILDFSGFNCEPNSEDYYTREVILRTMDDKTLESMGRLLCIGNLRALSANMEKSRLSLVSKIMNFLYKPKKKGRLRRSTGSTPNNRKAKSRNSSAKAGQNKPVENNSEGSKKSEKKSTRAGPLSFKKKVLSKEDMLLVENDLKKKVEAGKAVEPKVDLKRIDLSVFCQLLGENNSHLKNKDEEDSKGSFDSQSTEKENASPDGPKKLKDFSTVVSSIEGTPDELLMDIYFLIFLQSAEVTDMKEKILEFDGFSPDESPEKQDERKEFLERMTEDIVKGVSRAFYLNTKSDKNANVSQILSFLKEPQESFLKPSVIAPGMLSDCDLDFDDMSDSDDSITCEVVPKRVECIDLISSGEDSDKEGGKKVNKVAPPKAQAEQPTLKQVMVPPTVVPPVIVPQSESRDPNKKRTLRDFETITKIVNTHPNEYLVDIYNLLFMTPYEPSTLRKDILDFSGFEFEKGTPEYVKRKQFLDRMLYNSVRRIYNTLIHNTREVKVFSKPTMIGEIFQFLFKLPDTDTSIRLPPPKAITIRPTLLPIVNKEPEKVYVPEINLPPTSVFGLLNQSQKLSELKRVFQRVACFPCEYLVDVHKLLFMTDCEMKDIRANIFGFKGFSFGVDSPEFNQRKMYLEYLTFHSLRKISSVLTTKTVDLRNSTKHELASHLTQVLTEYTNTYFETEPIGSEAPAEENNEQVWSSLSYNFSENTVQEPTDPEVENIVVTPIIQPMERSPATTPEPPSEVPASKSNDSLDLTVSSSTSATEPQILMKALTNNEIPDVSNLTVRKISLHVDNSPQPSTTSKGRNKRKRASAAQVVNQSQAASKSEQMANMQFPDIYLPEVEKYQKIYRSNVNILPKALESSPGYTPGLIQNFAQNYVVDQQQNFGQQPFAHFGPTQVMQYPLLQAYPQHHPVQSPVFAMHAAAASARAQLDSPCHDNNEEDLEQHPVECILNEDVECAPSKRSKKKTKHTQEKILPETSDDNSMPSFQMKIRDAMTKASEDEEDCDKPLSTLVGHPNDKLLKQQICDIVEHTDLKDITMNGVIQKIFSMHPQYNLNYRKEFIKSTLRSLLYRLGDQEGTKTTKRIKDSPAACSPDCSVSTTDPRDSPLHAQSPPVQPIAGENWKSFPSPTFQQSQKS